MWPESSSVNSVNLVKKLLQFRRYRIFPRGLLFLARPVQCGDVFSDFSDTISLPILLSLTLLLLLLFSRRSRTLSFTVVLVDVGECVTPAGAVCIMFSVPTTK